jgi:hypothetical protein
MILDTEINILFSKADYKSTSYKLALARVLASIEKLGICCGIKKL